MKKKFTLGVIGAGNMASAILGGILNNSLIAPKNIIVSDIDDVRLAEFAAKGIAVTKDNKYLSANCDNLLFAVKPQSSAAIFESIKESITAEAVISIMAGISIKKMQAALGARGYARIMPNTPALVGEGMAAIAFSDGFSSDFVVDIFKALGETVILDEKHFDAVTSVSGSGPAYVYMFIKALVDGGIDGGLDEATARKLAVQTVRGAAKMVMESDKPIAELIDAVCSKGGTTIQAVESFKADGLEEIVIKGMVKCRNRSKELGNA